MLAQFIPGRVAPVLALGLLAGVAWGADNASLLYVKPDEQMRPFQVWRHVLGTAQDDDRLVYEDPDERFFVNLTSPINASIADAQGVGTIQDDDLAQLSIECDQNPWGAAE